MFKKLKERRIARKLARNAAKINKKIIQMRDKDLLYPRDISDGNHTFNELYQHRMALTAALTKSLHLLRQPGVEVYKAKQHYDGSMFVGSFVVMIEYRLNKGGKPTADSKFPAKQISYHYKLEFWDTFDIPERESSSEYDGHTAETTAARLLELFGS